MKPIKEKTIEFKHGRMITNGKAYKVEVNRDGKPELVIDVNFEKYKKKAEQIAQKLKYCLDQEAVLKENIMNLDYKGIDKLYKIVFKSKKKYKPKTREHHCVDMKIGNFILPIVQNQ